MKRGGRIAFEKIRRATYDKDGRSSIVSIDDLDLICDGLVRPACYESLIAIRLVTKIATSVLACSALAC